MFFWWPQCLQCAKLIKHPSASILVAKESIFPLNVRHLLAQLGQLKVIEIDAVRIGLCPVGQLTRARLIDGLSATADAVCCRRH